MARYTELTGRGAITVMGADRIEFLQGLVSNDVARAASGHPVWAALLTPQGKYRHDVFIFSAGSDSLILDCEGGDRMMDLGQTLRRYVLRADAKLGLAQDIAHFAVWGDDAFGALGLEESDQAPFAGGTAFRDPRLPAMGARILAPKDTALEALADLDASTPAAWDAHRIALGLPDGSRDMPPDKAILLENGFDELHGVDWQKGCYMGQELTARTKYRGLVKKRLVPVRIDGTPPAEGSDIVADGRNAGTLFSIAGDRGLALVRLDALKKEAPLEASGAVLRPDVPDWMSLPE